MIASQADTSFVEVHDILTKCRIDGRFLHPSSLSGINRIKIEAELGRWPRPGVGGLD